MEGYLTLIDDADTGYAILAESSRIHEATLPHPWQLTDAPQDYLQVIYK
ncbi:hypothetical protein IR141_09140 [Neisseria sp. 19428wB4_WF04]|nr:hypothetical protein [Neisseria sp. 19428wB4_WF04]TFU40509.1 hypothetical protein E4T99_09085 [Neisseria sp. WF04]